jgi:hypothetical protein
MYHQEGQSQGVRFFENALIFVLHEIYILYYKHVFYISHIFLRSVL